MKVARDTYSPWHGLPVTPFRDWKVKVTRPVNDVTKKSAISLEWEGLRTSNLVCGWSTMTDMRGDLHREISGWLLEDGGIKHWWSSSVTPDPKLRTERRGKLKIGMKEARDTVTRDPIQRSKDRVRQFPTWKVCVAVQVATCRGRPHYRLHSLLIFDLWAIYRLFQKSHTKFCTMTLQLWFIMSCIFLQNIYRK